VRCIGPLLALLSLGCVSDVGLELEIRARAPVPAEVSSWELRLLRLEGPEVCPSVEQAAGAAPVGRLAHTQTFEAEGTAIGPVPEGRWGLSVIARDAACGVRMYGCSDFVIGSGVESPIVVEVEATSSLETCGCRACAAGVCAGPEVCE